ncbi:MAG: ATP-binding cassette domain-containing protein [Peptococcaceae bacterium]|nr:ATP-binding cassette domain-containing protein [Peptococcaceae bacterium]
MIYTLKDVSYAYTQAKEAVLDAFDWQIAPHERWGLVGPSGCGKTTLLYLLAGLKQPDRGTCHYNGKPCLAPVEGVSFIQQNYGLFRWKTVRQNLSLPLLLAKMPRAEITARVDAMTARLGLSGLADQYPAQLSGGQCQRVAIGRALINAPKVLLMDEPFSALDAMTREGLQEEMLALSLDSGVTLVLVTHSIEEAVYMCDKLLVYAKNSAAPLVVDNSATSHDRYAADFVKQCARVKAMLEGRPDEK